MFTVEISIIIIYVRSWKFKNIPRQITRWQDENKRSQLHSANGGIENDLVSSFFVPDRTRPKSANTIKYGDCEGGDGTDKIKESYFVTLKGRVESERQKGEMKRERREKERKVKTPRKEKLNK